MARVVQMVLTHIARVVQLLVMTSEAGNEELSTERIHRPGNARHISWIVNITVAKAEFGVVRRTARS